MKLYYFTFLILIPYLINSQSTDRFSLDLSLFRFSGELGLYGDEPYPNRGKFMNALQLNYRPSRKIEYTMGGRYVNLNKNYGTGFTRDSSVRKGVEFNLGVRLITDDRKFLFVKFGLEFISEFSKQRGTFWLDHPPVYELNHRYTFIGGAATFSIHHNFNNQFGLFIRSRWRVGRTARNKSVSTDPQKELFPDYYWWDNILEPVNNFGLTVKFR